MNQAKNVSEKRYIAMLTLRNCFRADDLGVLAGWTSVISAMMIAEGDDELTECAKIVHDFFTDEALDISLAHCREAAKPFSELIAQSIGHYLDGLDDIGLSNPGLAA